MSIFKFGEILLPENINVTDWGVVACDQYTSQPEYWNTLATKTSDISSLALIFPECFLSSDNSERILSINNKMNEYVQKGIFKEYNGTILVERTTESGTRRGIMACIDLSSYSNDFAEKAPIRGTEGVVAERIPPRVEIRKNASLELPHVMLLIDDKDKTVIEPLIGKGEKVYDGELNMNGGYIAGYNVQDTTAVELALDKLFKSSQDKYGSPLLFLVGDGNHSLATAKACMDESNPLSKYALVEIVNIYDEGLKFEPIYRVVYDVDNDDFIKGYTNAVKGGSSTQILTPGKTETIDFIVDPIEGFAKTQMFIDEYLKTKGGKVDYIHGLDSLREVVEKTKGVGIELKPIDKETFFEYIAKNGPLPRKTFSMGEANEKRYYIECRKINKE